MTNPNPPESIEKQVDCLVTKCIFAWVGRFAAAFGVVNIVTLIGLWVTVTSEARALAREEAQKQAKEAAAAGLEHSKQLFDKSLESLTALNTKSAELYQHIGKAEAGRERIDAVLKSLDDDLKNLRDQFDRLKKADYGRVEKLVEILGRLPEDDKKLVEAFDKIGRRTLKVQYNGRHPFVRCSFVAGPAGNGNAARTPEG